MKTFGKDGLISTFTPNYRSIGTVTLGEPFRLETVDCYDGQVSSERVKRPDVDMRRFDLATGPVAVEGVTAGDIIEIRFHAIELADRGAMLTTPGLGMLGDQISVPETRLLPVKGESITFPGGHNVSVDPMVGIVGVATRDEGAPTSVPGTHGGNLDTKRIRPGTSLVLRAEQDGAGLALGDLHAVMGDGELGGTGVEIGGAITLEVRRSQQDFGTWPVLLDGDGFHILASSPTLEDAVREAFADGVSYYRSWYGLAWPDAYRLASITGDAAVSQVVNQHRTARFQIPWRWVGPPWAPLT